jgi:hypothetical protein
MVFGHRQPVKLGIESMGGEISLSVIKLLAALFFIDDFIRNRNRYFLNSYRKNLNIATQFLNGCLVIFWIDIKDF